MALTDQIRQPVPSSPPNLRQAEGQRGCATCKWFKATSLMAGRCGQFGNTPVRPMQLCDGWTAQSGGM